MSIPGTVAGIRLADGRTLDYWEGGDPAGPTVLFQPGLPASRLMGLHYHPAAVQTGTRLVSVSRPGYGGSSAVDHPSLRAAAADAVQLADQLGIDSFATVGVSGGAPFAIATALVAPERTRALGLVAGAVPWVTVPELMTSDTPDGRAFTLARAGDREAATQIFRADAEESFGPMLAEDDEAMVAHLLSIPPGGGRAHEGPEFRHIWAVDLREALGTYDGYVHDVLAWAGCDEVAPSQVTVPTFLWYGEADSMVPVETGQWLASQIPGAALTQIPGEGHGEVSFTHCRDILERVA